MKFDPEQIRTLVGWLAAARINAMEWRTATDRLSLQLEFPGSAPAASLSAATALLPAAQRDTVELCAAVPGRYLAGHPLGEVPLVGEGSMVEDGQLVALLQAGVLLQPVRASAAGRVIAVLATPGQVLGHGDPLLRIELASEDRINI